MISNYGRVWSVVRENRGRLFGGYMMRIDIDKRNRCSVALNRNGTSKRFIISRLVATAFIRSPQKNEEVNHLDENPLNNHVNNLEWCTHKYNCNYGTRVQRIKDKQNIPVLQYTLDGEFIAEHKSMHVAAESINADAGHICDCCMGNRKWAYGYFWRYKDEQLYEKAKKRITSIIEKGKKSRADKFTERALNVIQFDLDGNYIQTFPSTNIAAKSIGTHRPSIINCCNGKAQSAKGYKWKYEKDYLKTN